MLRVNGHDLNFNLAYLQKKEELALRIMLVKTHGKDYRLIQLELDSIISELPYRAPVISPIMEYGLLDRRSFSNLDLADSRILARSLDNMEHESISLNRNRRSLITNSPEVSYEK